MKIIQFLLILLLINSSIWAQTIKVKIIGEVVKPGEYELNEGSRLYDLIMAAGGYKEGAYLRGAKFYRKVIKIEEETLQQEISIKYCKSYLLSDGKDLIRIPIELKHPRLLKNSTSDILLKDGDFLEIPLKIDTINVFGSVLKPGAYLFEKKYDLNDYITTAGGVIPGKKVFIYLYKVDGKVELIKNSFIFWNEFENRWEFSIFSKRRTVLEPGDTIVVQEMERK